MAYKGKIIRNPFTKQDILFLQTGNDTNGELLEMESTYHPYSEEPASHYHPLQDEKFRVIAGELTVRINGITKVLKEGDTLFVPSNTHHAMWNASGISTVINWQVKPAMQTEFLLETITGLANDGRTNEKGMPSLLQTSLTVSKFDEMYRLSRPRYEVLKFIFTLLTPFATAAGLKPTYKRYFE